VRGRWESRRAPAIFVLAGLVIGLALPGSGGADPAQSFTSLQHRQHTLAATSHAALLSLYSLDSRLAQARSELARLHSEAAAVRIEQARAKREAGIAKDAWRKSVNALGDHLRAIYEEGQPDAIVVLLGATSIDDAMTRLDELERSAKLNRLTLQQARAAEGSLAHLRRELTARAAQVQRLETQAGQTMVALSQARAQRVSYIASLTHERALNAQQISRLESSAQQITTRSQVVAAQTAAPPSTAGAAPPAAPVTGGRQMTVTATGYSLGGHTATGMPVGWGVVAVDPSVIPLGTRMTIPGYGEGVAADTGSAVVGATIDLWFPTTAQALAWGRRTVTITLH
jgi:cystine transport system substrate-binding protein